MDDLIKERELLRQKNKLLRQWKELLHGVECGFDVDNVNNC